jgi:inosine-uridine nucleoside N-ribohydrolase
MLHKIWSAVWPIGTMETGGLGWPAHDLLATFASVHPEAFSWETLPVAVDTAGGPAWGATAVDRRLRGLDGELLALAESMLTVAPARWAIAFDADRDAFRSAMQEWMA